MGCPNLLDENILQEFLELKSIVGERLAYLIYDKRNSFFRTNEDGLINQEFITRNKSFSSQRDTILSMAIEELENIDSDYIEKIKNSLNETNASDNIKPEVKELFESNPKLANEVYEALGFGQLKEPKVNDIVTLEFYFEKEDKIVPVKVKITELEKFYQGASTIKDNQGNIIKQEKGTLEYFLTLEKLDGGKKYEVSVGEDGYINQFVGGTGKTRVVTNNYIPEFDLSKSQITPQQKQQAQQLYGSYLQTTNNPTIEGFKQWNSRQQQVSELFESNPTLANEVYEALGFIDIAIEYPDDIDKSIIPILNVLNKNGIKTFASHSDVSTEHSGGKTGIAYLDVNNIPDGTYEKLQKAGFIIDGDFLEDMGGIVDTIEFPKDLSDVELKNKWNQLANILLKTKNIDYYNQITPQQKQQAQQLYSEYLSQNPNGSVEGFKSWVDNNQSNVQYQLPQGREKEEFVASEKTIRDLAARISDRIGIPVRYISDRSQQFKGKLDGDTAIINLAYATLDTPIHEILGHPIIRALKNNNFTMQYDENGKYIKNNTNQLYQNLLKELETGRGKEVLDRVKRDYQYKKEIPYMSSITKDATLYYDKNTKTGYIHDNSNPNERKTFNSEEEVRDYLNLNDKYTLEEQQEEAIVELLGLYTADRLDKVKDGELISLLKRLLKEMKAFMRNLLSQREVEIDKLPDIMTLGDIADLLAYSNSKLILPGNEVVYTTPDNQQFKTYAEASKRISDLAKSVEDIDLNNVNLSDLKIDKNNLPSDFKHTHTSSSASIAFMTDSRYNDEYNNKQRELKEKYKDKFIVVEKAGDSGVYPITSENQIFYNTKEEAQDAALDKSIENYKKEKSINGFIEKNKQYEQSKEIIEEWKKVNNIQYNPEEVYSRGQEFVSVVGAYSDFDVNLMMQNLLQHIEDNQKAGGEFTISAFTKPVEKKIGHLEGGGGKIKFKIYPQSNDIKWAANTDVSSGSVWDASEKVSKDKKSELLGVSYTKYPSLQNVNSVQPNLAAIVDDLAYHHNELGITLTGNNFRLEYDEDIPYYTKKIINSINSILDQKYGKLVKPDISTKDTGKVVYRVGAYFSSTPIVEFNSKEEAQDFINKYKQENANMPFKEDLAITPSGVLKGIQPTQTNETLKESIESVKDRVYVDDSNYETDLANYRKAKDGIIPEYYSAYTNLNGKLDSKINVFVVYDNITKIGQYIGMWQNDNDYDIVKDYVKGDTENKHGVKFWILSDEFKTEALNSYKKPIKKEVKEYTEQALVNTKIAKLKEVAKKYPRSLIRSEVRPINSSSNLGFTEDELPFQKISDSPFQQFQQSLNKPNTNPILQGNQQEQILQRNEVNDLIPNTPEQLEIDFGQDYIGKNIKKTHNLFLEDKGSITTEEYEKLPYKDNGLTKTFYANSESDADYWVAKYGAIKVKLFGKDVGKYKMVIKKPFEIDDLPSSVEKLPKEIEEAINRKKNVIQALKLKISKDNSRSNELKSKINLLNSRINKIKEKYKSDDFKLYEIAYEDVKLISENLKSFEKTLEGSNLTSNELRIIADKLIEVSYDIKGWIDVHNLVSEKYFGTEMDIANITGAIKMLDSKYKKILTNVFVRFAKLNTIYTELSEEDLSKAVADISIYDANVHTIGKSDIKLLKIVDDLLNNTATDINLEYQNKKTIINNQLKKAIDKLKISRNDLKEFFKQKRSDGTWTGNIIGEFKQEFYDKQSELIEEAKESKNWGKYFKWLNKNSKSFTSKELVEISKMDEESITKIGRFSEKEVLKQKKLINDYRSFYMASVELLGKLDKYIDGELIINENESNEGISVEFKHDDAKIVDNFYYEIDSIIKENSPFEYLSNKEKKVNSKIKNVGYYYIIRNKPNENWEDPKFKEIKENETLMETYNMIMNTLNENNKYLPILDEYQSNYMPELAKPLLQRISNNGLIGMFGGLKNEIINSITEEINNSEEIRPIIGSQSLSPIPIKMMSNNIITENKEDDIFKVLIEHSKMAISYKYKSQIEPLANASLDLIDAINEVSIKTTKAGSEYVTKFGKIKEREGGLVNAKKALKFRIESFLNNKSKDIEGVTKTKKKVKNLSGEIVEKNISLSKILDFLLGVTYAKQLGAPNVISPTVNLAYGLVSNLSYAAGGVYVSEKNLIKSFMDLHSIAIGVNSKSEKTEKILTFIDSFGIFGNLYDTEVADNGFIQKITFLQQKAELINQGSLVLAILKTIKLKDKNGNDISIYDAYTIDNGHLKWDTTKMEAQELLGNDVVYNKEKTQVNFKTLSSFINEIVEEVHGDYKNPMMIKKTVLMRAVMQYKRFIPNSVKHRFGKEYENMNLIDEKTGKRGVLVKGRYLSYINSKIFDEKLNQYVDAKFGDIVKILISGLLFNKKNIQQLKEIDRINMMRNIRELHFILLSMAAIMALESLINDDDDNDFMVKILINSISKTQADMMFFLNPSSMSQMTNNFIPVLSTIEDMKNLIYSSFKMLYGDIYYENGPWKDYSRLGVSAMRLFPGTNGAVKMWNYGSQVFEFN